MQLSGSGDNFANIICLEIFQFMFKNKTNIFKRFSFSTGLLHKLKCIGLNFQDCVSAIQVEHLGMLAQTGNVTRISLDNNFKKRFKSLVTLLQRSLFEILHFPLTGIQDCLSALDGFHQQSFYSVIIMKLLKPFADHVNQWTVLQKTHFISFSSPKTTKNLSKWVE